MIPTVLVPQLKFIVPVPVTLATVLVAVADTFTLVSSVVNVYDVVPLAKVGEILYPSTFKELKVAVESCYSYCICFCCFITCCYYNIYFI